MRWLAVAVVLAAFFGLTSVVEAVIPCADPRGCPDLIALTHPNKWFDYQITLETFDASHCAVQEGSTQAGQRKLLRFTASFANIGDGDLIIGRPEENPEWFTFSDCHRHFHFTEYADYRLWDASHTTMIASNKMGFCVIDVRKYQGGEPWKYFQCQGPYQASWHQQGLSKGWVDQYGMFLDGQWIDVTGLPSGQYLLEIEVNAEHLFQESNFSNNTSTKAVVIP